MFSHYFFSSLFSYEILSLLSISSIWSIFSNTNFNLTRMTIFIKTKMKISEDQTNIDKYRLAANITVNHIISKLILQRIIITNFCDPVSYLEIQYRILNPHRISKSKKKKNIQIVVLTVIWGKYNIGFWIPIEFREEKRFKSLQKLQN